MLSQRNNVPRSTERQNKASRFTSSMQSAVQQPAWRTAWCPSNTADELRRRRSPNGEREAAAFITPLPARPPRSAVSSIRSFCGPMVSSLDAPSPRPIA